MSANANLHKAKDAKNDEFYTQLTDVSKELMHYKEHFKGKIVLCNCDDPEWSNFWKYFVRNFEHIGIKKVISTHFEADGSPSYKMEYDGTKDSDGNPVFVKIDLIGNGDFRSDECIAILDEADIVVTNPPFSIFREYINTLIAHGKQFVILGNMNNITYKDVFPHIKENRLRLGVNSGSMEFRVPDTFEKDNVYEKDGVKYAKFGNICWYTNLEHYRMHEFLELNDKYKGNEEKYPKYDNYDAIEVGRLDDIPGDYYETMGVPLTILCHYNPEQFEIVWQLSGNTRKNIPDSLSKALNYIQHKEDRGGCGVVDNKRKYTRVLIKRRKAS